MTERDWLTSDDGPKMADFWKDRFTERKGRPLMLACCRRRSAHFADPVLWEAVNALADHYADPVAPDRPFDGKEYENLYARLDEYFSSDLPDPVDWVTGAVHVAAKPNPLFARDNQEFSWAVWSCLFDSSTESGRDGDGRPVPGEAAAQAVPVREIVGNPFRPITCAPDWRTGAVLALARQVYATEDFSAAPVLADALQGAGCDRDDLLNHLRHGSGHVRGCWALDLVLGLS